MLEKINKFKTEIVAIFLAILGFAIIRNYEDLLFYDPFLNFFKEVSSTRIYPEIIQWKLYINLLFRYLLNSGLSLIIIYSLYKNKDYLKLAGILYLFFFIILMVLFIVALHYFKDQLMYLFYIRRFLIQPLFLLLFIPGFYFQQQDLKK